MLAYPVKSFEYRTQKQPLSGFTIGFERRDVWRVRISIGRRLFDSDTPYASYEAAKRAAAAMNKGEGA